MQHSSSPTLDWLSFEIALFTWQPRPQQSSERRKCILESILLEMLKAS